MIISIPLAIPIAIPNHYHHNPYHTIIRQTQEGNIKAEISAKLQELKRHEQSE
jgi:hypothetical protein